MTMVMNGKQSLSMFLRREENLNREEDGERYIESWNVVMNSSSSGEVTEQEGRGIYSWEI